MEVNVRTNVRGFTTLLLYGILNLSWFWLSDLLVSYQLLLSPVKMPTLGDLNCSVELGRRNNFIREYGVFYGNKTVSCYICAPPRDINFSIHLTSTGLNGFTAAPGLAMFVFIDGQYQCNRNMTTIEEQGGAIDLRVRQKEEPTEGRQFIGRDWSCSALKTGHYIVHNWLCSLLTVYCRIGIESRQSQP